MRKFSLLAIVLLASALCSGVARAELSITETIGKIPKLNQGVGFSIIDSGFNYLTTFDIVQYKGFGLEAGYAGRQKNTGDKLVAVVSYDLFNAKKAGVTLPILDLIDVRVGAYVGVGRIQLGSEQVRDGNNEFDTGFSLSALKVKF